jgi:hypothetical protein
VKARTWLWGLGALVVALAIVAVVIAVTRDSDSDESAATTTTTTVASTTTGATPNTTTAPATTRASSTTLPIPPVTDDPQSYAQFLFTAWKNGNQAAAAQVASPQAVSQMFAQPYQPGATWTFDSCGPAAGSLYCTWDGPNSASIQITVRTLTGGLPVLVVAVQRPS